MKILIYSPCNRILPWFPPQIKVSFNFFHIYLYNRTREKKEILQLIHLFKTTNDSFNSRENSTGSVSPLIQSFHANLSPIIFNLISTTGYSQVIPNESASVSIGLPTNNRQNQTVPVANRQVPIKQTKNEKQTWTRERRKYKREKEGLQTCSDNRWKFSCIPLNSTRVCIYRGDEPVNILGQATWSETSYRQAPLCYKCWQDVGELWGWGQCSGARNRKLNAIATGSVSPLVQGACAPRVSYK